MELTEAEKIEKLESESPAVKAAFISGREQNRQIRIVTINRIAGQPIGIVIGSYIDDRGSCFIVFLYFLI